MDSNGIDLVGKSILDTGKPNEARAVIQDALAKARVQQKRGHEAELLIILGTLAESTGDGTDAKITGDFL